MTHPLRQKLKPLCIAVLATFSLCGISVNAHVHPGHCNAAMMERDIDYAQRSTYGSDGQLSHKLFDTEEYCSQLQAHIDQLQSRIDRANKTREESEETDRNEKLDKRKTQEFEYKEPSKSRNSEWEEWRWEGKE